MPDRCVLGYCSNTRKENVQLFQWPTDKTIARKWNNFVALTRSDFKAKPRSLLCSAHFTDEDFENHMAVRFNCQKVLRLKKDAVPSIRPKRAIDDIQCKIW